MTETSGLVIGEKDLCFTSRRLPWNKQFKLLFLCMQKLFYIFLVMIYTGIYIVIPTYSLIKTAKTKKKGRAWSVASCANVICSIFWFHVYIRNPFSLGIYQTPIPISCNGHMFSMSFFLTGILFSALGITFLSFSRFFYRKSQLTE